MILYPPEHFDINEWFTLISLAVTATIAFLLPKRFSPVAITVYTVFTVFISQSVDSLIAVKPFDMYDVNDSSKYELMDIVIYYLNYPPYTYIFLYFYDKWKLKGIGRILYVGVFSGFSVFFEWLACLCHVFTFHGWKLWYSPFVYLVTFTLYIIVYHATEKVAPKPDGV
ncbi:MULTISPECIES: hypothetical protein [Paenibacillus]|uniref:Uncharacterized protein n=1 Tax=Paenibacillus violae TaxID=3077234 RepID=A0ABU3RM82_9BACL|nr:MULTISPECIES: hypothetical protein [Paenibacillus]MDU0204957.1 hypothetical protein [Paenibacillus sp. PFR10]MEC0269657.1 hypothetical protein [Paenibacillus anseongense]